MSAVEGRQIFREYYTSQLKTEVENTSIKTVVKETFNALASYRENRFAVLHLGDREIKVSDLTLQEINLFSRFAKAFFNKIPLGESDAKELREKIPAAAAGTIKLIGYEKEGWKKTEMTRRFDRMEEALFIHEKLKPVDIQEGDIGKEVEVKIAELLKKQQDLGKESFQKADKINTASKILGAIMIFSFFPLAPLVAIVGAFFFPPLIIVGLSLFGVTAVGLLGFSMTDSWEMEERERVQSAKRRFESLERYKDIIKEPDYQEFIKALPKGDYDRIKQRGEDLSLLVELYAKEKEYQKRQQVIDRLAEATELEKNDELWDKITPKQNLEAIQSLRRELKLPPYSLTSL